MFMNTRKFRLIAGLPFVAVGLVSIPSAAQTNEVDVRTVAEAATDSEEILVTAQRRSQSMQDVGISMVAFGGEELRELNVVSSMDVARLTPGVHVSGNVGGQASQFTIRGVTQNDFNDAIEAPVAVYVDDTYIPSMQGQTFGLFDLERVEVLKGPQGTLFGRNATGGLVHYIVSKPTDKIEARLDGTYGRFNSAKIEGAVNLPLSDTVALRFSGLLDRNDPYWKNIYPSGSAGGIPVNLGGVTSPCCEDEAYSNTLAGRIQLQFKPNDDLTVRLVGSAARQHLSTGQYTQSATVAVVDAAGRVVNAIYAQPNETRTAIGPTGGNFTLIPNSPPSRAPGADWFGFVAPSGKSLNLSKDFAVSDLNRTETWNSGLHVDYKLGEIDLVSVTNYMRFKKNFSMDVDASPTSLVNYGTIGDTDSFSQEVRLSGSSEKFTWTAGVFYLNIDAKSSNGFLAPAFSIFSSVFGATTTGIDLVNTFRLKTESSSIFGQAEYKLSPVLKVIAGARLIREHQEYNFQSNAMADNDPLRIDAVGVPLFPLQPSFQNSRTKTLWAGKMQIEYQPNSDLLFYAGVNRGVKGGSYNAKLPDGTPPLTEAQIPYQSEVLLSYEGGVKATFLEGKADFNASAYYYDYSDYQAFTFSNVSGYVQNRPARTYGSEVELRVRPLDGLQLGASASLFNARVKQLEIAPGVQRDVRPTYAPETQLAVRISYTPQIDIAGGLVTLGADGSYTSGFYHNLRNFDANYFDGYAVFNARVNWEDNAERLRLGFFISNLTDKRYKTVGYDLSTLCGCTEESYGKPRWWGVSAGLSF
jgi:iron complex outermembrane receptor protein